MLCELLTSHGHEVRVAHDGPAALSAAKELDPQVAVLDIGLPSKTVTGFADVEEDFADNAVWGMGALPKDKHLMPWRIEGELKKLGANFVQAGMWRGFAVRDGNLITGQQNFSGTETANLVVATLGH